MCIQQHVLQWAPCCSESGILPSWEHELLCHSTPIRISPCNTNDTLQDLLTSSTKQKQTDVRP